MPPGRSPARTEPESVLFLDRCLDHADIASALRAAGATVERHVDHFGGNSPDEVWLPAVAARGWAVLTKDKAIQRREVEERAWRESGAAVFALSSGQLGIDQTAAALGAALPRIRQILQKYTRPLWAFPPRGPSR